MSQFDGLLSIKTNQKTEAKPKPKSTNFAAVNPPLLESPDGKQMAKSRHSDYTQTSIYIKKETLTAVKKTLLDDKQNRDFSELVEELLTGWVRKNQQ
jgi:hypothetical protein